MQRTHLFLLSVIFIILPGQSLADSDIIRQLTQKIAQATSDEEKGRLHIFRARNYNNMGNTSMAEKDYDAALAFDHKGWIHLERSRYFLSHGDYELAKKDALAAEKETPTLKSQTQKIIAHTEKFLKKEQQTTNETQKEILLTKKWKARYKPTPARTTVKKTNIRAAYAARSKARAQKKPRRRARS